ncbi:MAG: hypothetical protein VKQ33_03370 [Candidatus Sericytochromatia bacterium]|nr:hypothetical protein [Candidatus Sericytochromatia bacterium]
MTRTARRPGANLLEVLIAASVVGLVLMALGAFITGGFRAGITERDRAFATQKALQMLEEVGQRGATAAQAATVQALDGSTSFALTTVAGASPDDPLSGNPRDPAVPGRYKYVRAITVTSEASDPQARLVTVKVWYNHADNAVVPPDDPLAVASGLVRTQAVALGSRQVLEVYVLSIENLPHVLRKSETELLYPSAAAARSLLSASLSRLEAQFPGFQLRIHYVTRLSEGRDPGYRPYVNDEQHLDGRLNGGRDDLAWAYLYPGRLDAASDSPHFFDLRDLRGRYLRGRPAAAPVVENAAHHAFADQFNHAVRHADEFVEPFGAAVTPAGADGGDVSPLSFRQLLEDMLWDQTGKYAQAVVVNLHGELLPVVPLRNYSDPAKDPGDAATDARIKERRLVTHPYKLVTPVDEPLRLLVHPFMADGLPTSEDTLYPTPDPSDADRYIKTDWVRSISLRYATQARLVIKGIKPYMADTTGDGVVTVDDVTLWTVQRERETAGTGTRYVRVVAWPPSLATSGVAPLGGEEDTTRGDHSGPHVTNHPDAQAHHGNEPLAGTEDDGDPYFDGDDLVIKVTDLDYDARQATAAGLTYGLDHGVASQKLYGLQYFPDPVLPFLEAAVSADASASPSAPLLHGPRNTARIGIQLQCAAGAVGRRFEVVTVLKTASGWAADTDRVPAVSRTYAYVGEGSDASWWADGGLYTNVPPTDQLCVVGDPRHNPYADVRVKGNDAAATPLYSAFWQDFTAGHAVYPGITNTGTAAENFVAPPNPLLSNAELAALGTAPTGQVSTAFAHTAATWNGTHVNAPAFYRLMRAALIRNGITFVNPVGTPGRLVGLGGEFSLSGSVDGWSGMRISAAPYGGSTGSDAGSDADELLAGGARLIRRASDGWVSLPWLGELYPSDRYASSWATSGNLPAGNGSTAFARVTVDEVTGWDAQADASPAHDRKDAGLTGFASLLGAAASLTDAGSLSPATPTAQGQAWLASLGLTLSAAASHRITLAASGGTAPDDWTLGLFPRERTTLLAFSSVAPAPEAYWTDGSGGRVVVPLRLRYQNPPSWPGLSAYPAGMQAAVLTSTLVPGSAAEAPGVFDVAAAAMLWTALDFTHGNYGDQNFKALPRVKITAPAQGATLSGSSTPLTFFGKWVRADGQAYSPFTPLLTGYPPASDGPADVRFNVKYRLLPDGAWKTADVGVGGGANTTTSAGHPVPGQALAFTGTAAYPPQVSVSWGLAGLAPGPYVLRVEAFRHGDPNPLDFAPAALLPGHHSFHEIDLRVAN